MNTRFWVIFAITICVGGYISQPAVAQCVTNKIKGTTFSNCADGVVLEGMQKSDRIRFKESASDDSLSQHLNGKSTVQFKEDIISEGGKNKDKDGVKPDDQKNFHSFKETPRELKPK